MGTVEHYPCCAQSRTERNTGIDDARGTTAASLGSLRYKHRKGALVLLVLVAIVVLIVLAMICRHE
jgi:hypothetical protein